MEMCMGLDKTREVRMEKKFTSGPWRVNEYRSILSEKEYIATTNTVPVGATANAHLIAAAPCMFEALETALLALQHPDQYEILEVTMHIKNILSKARGLNNHKPKVDE
jgi:hypothetical protein